MKEYIKLLLANKAWAEEKIQEDDSYFVRMAEDQTPNYLWIGCSDSRVPANEVIGAEPGELFVHRNIANMVVHTDLNLLSVLQYAVEELKVKHIIVCGHYGCGGVRAALNHHNMGMLNKWLRNVKDVYRLYSGELEGIDNVELRLRRLIELNVKEQVINLSKTSIVQKAWKYHQRPHIHGWVYGLDDGILKTIYDLPPGSPVEPIYQYDDL
ncbi:MAG: carbonic anhydrase [Bacteroidetes bacterium]|nr:carbonic anhydrase [Bacteroidota bacterium]